MVKSIPKSEDGHGVLVIRDKHNYMITLNTNAMRFTLWQIKPGKPEEYDKIGTADTPLKLYKKIDQLEGV